VQVPRRAQPFTIDPRRLALTHLAYFVGTFANREVLAEMERAGYGDLREPHGYLFQHLLAEPRSVGQLSKLMGVTQQAVSKTVAELMRAGYVETAVADDARVRLVRLSEKGHASVLASRRAREKLERRLTSALGKKRAAALRTGLAELVEELGATDAVKARRVPAPEAARSADSKRDSKR
jgi:DNA-binding MarR family transcriptional regulator